MKVKTTPIFVSLFVSLLVLFGGWFSYEQFYIQRPIEGYISSLPNVVLKNIQVNSNSVVVDVDFKDPTKFADDYKEIYDTIHDKVPGKTISIHLPKDGDALKELWDQEYFSFAQAIERKEYGQVPQIVDKMKKDGKLDKSIARMDDKNIYLYLQEGKEHMYAVLPLNEGGASTNE